MRKKRAEIRRLAPDTKYNDLLVAKLINYLMYQGKKSTATTLVYDAFDIIQDKQKEEPLEVFKKAISNIAPVLEVRSRRVGGATYLVPVEVKENPPQALALRWLKIIPVTEGKNNGSKISFRNYSASKGEGSSFRKRRCA